MGACREGQTMGLPDTMMTQGKIVSMSETKITATPRLIQAI